MHHMANMPSSSTITADAFPDLADDPEFQEFLSVQRSVAKDKKNNKKQQVSYVWANDIDTGMPDLDRDSGHEDEEPEDDEKPVPHKSSKSRTAVPQSEFTIKLRELPYKAKKGEIKRWFAPLTVTRVKLPGRIKGIAYVSFKTAEDMAQGLRKHKSILSGHQVLISVHKQEDDGRGQTQAAAPSEPKPYHVIQESVADTGRLYIRNLSYSCSSQDLEDLFSPFGELTEVYLPIDPASKKVKGFAFVTFMFPEHAIAAMDQLDKTKFQERLIHILPGESKPDKFAHYNNLSSFKKKKETQLIEDRTKSSTWNTLFLGANAAADVMSAMFNVKKSDLIADTNTSDSIAVRMALGETQIVNETKQFLIDNGINLDAFTEDVIKEGVNPNEVQVRKRSRTVILVKNLPVGTKSEDLEKLFTRFGIVTRVIIPVHGVTAIVQMQEEQEAKKAFASLINYKLNHVPVYLEWAPLDVFGKGGDGKADRKGVKSEPGGDGQRHGHGVEEDKIDAPATRRQGEDQGEDEKRNTSSTGASSSAGGASASPGFRLFVKNISFDTSDEAFEKHFQSVGSLLSASISRKKGTACLSNGYGFVVYKSEKSAEKALRGLQNSMLDGHCLQVQRSHHPVSGAPPPASSSPAFTAGDPPVSPQTTRGRRTGQMIDSGSSPDAGVTVSRSELHKEASDRKRPATGGAATGAASTDATASESGAKSVSGKLLVRNIPFEASSSEVEQVFNAFPGLKSVRLPKKMTVASAIGMSGNRSKGPSAGSHRGFAFIEYSSRSQAEKALESLAASTHLYGRRLVLEWAKAMDENETSASDSLYDRRKVIASDITDRDGAGEGSGGAGKRFKKSNLNSSLRSASGKVLPADPLDFDSLA